MARSRHQQSVPLPKTKKNCVGDSQLDEDSWIIVKKQKVTILIPPLPAPKQSMLRNARDSPPIHVTTIKPTDTQSTHVEMHNEADLVCEWEEPVSLEPQLTIPSLVAEVVPQSISQFPRPWRPNNKTRESLETGQMLSFRSKRTIGLCSLSKIPKRSADGVTMINKRLRALNLERQLQSAGGLKSWLVSRGLDHFVNIFHGKSINKYELANLTMEKLKEMGSHAVGPRRKLIHAIDCLCHPCSFQHYNTRRA